MFTKIDETWPKKLHFFEFKNYFDFLNMLYRIYIDRNGRNPLTCIQTSSN